MKKLLLRVGSLIALLLSNVALADEVGRVRLTLPQGEWVTVSTNDSDLTYGGHGSGTIKAQTTARALIDKEKNLLAILFIRASSSAVSGAPMEFTSGCKTLNTEYVDDATTGSYTRLDCLRVWRAMNPTAWIKKNAVATNTELDQRGIKSPMRGYQFSYQVGMPNGTFIAASGIISYGPLALIPDAKKDAKYAGMPGVAYGQAFAEAVRTSVRSLSGELTVPQIDYR